MKILLVGIFLFFYWENGLCENLKLLILHNNDMHSRFEETSRTSGTCKDKTNCYGGFARVLHVIREARKAAADGTGPPVLYLNAGDTYTGTSWFSVHKWKIAADFLNLLHPDVACFGNHEFMYKSYGLAPFLNAITFPMIAANIDFSREKDLKSFNITKSWIFNIEGKRIGVIGYTTPCTMYTAYTENVHFSNEIKAIKLESEILRSLGVKTIIALGHSGFDQDLKIAREVPLVDLVIGGHSHTLQWNGVLQEFPEKPKSSYPMVVEQTTGKKVPMVQAYAFTKYIGQLTVTINDEGQVINFDGFPQLLNSSVPQDPDALSLLEMYRPKIQELDAITVARSVSKFQSDPFKCHYQECILGNVLTDAYVDYFKKRRNVSVIGLVTTRSISYGVESKPDGTITMLDLLTALPYSGKVYSLSLKGVDILNILETGASKDIECARLGFVHPSGIKYNIDLYGLTGKKVSKVTVRCDNCNKPVYQNLILQKTYRVVVSELLYIGADLHLTVKKSGFDIVEESKTELEIIQWYLNKTSLIDNTVAGRINFLTKDKV